MNYYSNPLSPNYDSSYAFFSLWLFRTQNYLSPLLVNGLPVKTIPQTFIIQQILDPTIYVTNSSQLNNFLNSDREQCIITNDINVNFNLTSSNGIKTILSDNSIKITKI